MSSSAALIDQIMARLTDVIEPELGRDIVSLHMVRHVTIEDATVRLTLALITPTSPVQDHIASEVRQAVLEIDGIHDAEIAFDLGIPTTSPAVEQMGLHIKNIVAVTSGKGGVGKSTVAANVAIALARRGIQVGLMDADITGPNLPIIMGLYGRRPITGSEKMIPLEAYGVKVISMGFLIDPDKPIIWRGPMIHHAIRQLFTDVEWGNLDYMIVDLPPGTGDAQLTLAQSVPLSGALIVTQPQQMAVGDALRGLTMFEAVDVPILGIAENMSGDFFGEGGGRQLAESRGVPFLASIPLDPKVRIGGDTGRPIVVEDPQSPAAIALTRLALEVAARIADIASGQSSAAIQLKTVG